MTLSDEIRQAVENALSEQIGGRVQITSEAHNFPSSSVFRCTLLKSSASDPTKTVIVRIAEDWMAHWGRIKLYNEQAALEYLGMMGSKLAPRYLAGGGTAGFLVSEDLGEDPSLLDLLLGSDPDAAKQGALAFARGLGKLHAQTAGPPDGPPRAVMPIVQVPVMDHWQTVETVISRLKLPKPKGVGDDIKAISSFLAEPGDCVALSSGDASVVNCKVTSDSIKFFDFERACFQHVLIDAAVLRYLYPTGGPAWRVPPDLASQIESAYRAEISKVCSIAQDDNRYELGMAAACAAWTIIRLKRLPKVDAGPDRDPWTLLPPGWSGPAPTRSRRRQLVSILETCIASTRRANAFEAFTAWCECLVDTLRDRWPEAAEDLPLYPAFS